MDASQDAGGNLGVDSPHVTLECSLPPLGGGGANIPGGGIRRMQRRAIGDYVLSLDARSYASPAIMFYLHVFRFRCELLDLASQQCYSVAVTATLPHPPPDVFNRLLLALVQGMHQKHDPDPEEPGQARLELRGGLRAWRGLPLPGGR